MCVRRCVRGHAGAVTRYLDTVWEQLTRDFTAVRPLSGDIELSTKVVSSAEWQLQPGGRVGDVLTLPAPFIHCLRQRCRRGGSRHNLGLVESRIGLGLDCSPSEPANPIY